MRGIIIAAAAAMGLASSAQAVSYFSLTANAADPGLAGYERVLTSFDGGNAVGYSNASNFAITNAAANAPLGDTSNYGQVSAGGSVAFDLRNAFSSRTTAARSLSVYLGSVTADDYIQVIGLSVGGGLNLANPLMTISGSDLLAVLGADTTASQRLYINFSAAEQVSALIFGSASSVFGFDTLAVSSAVYAITPGQTVAPGNKRPSATIDNSSPNQSSYMLSSNGAQMGSALPEPANWAMMISGFLMVGGMLRARRRATVVFF
jgi:hypothetical protein